MAEPIWRPAPDRAAGTRLARFVGAVRDGGGPCIDDYAGLHQWSIDSPEQFWPAVADYCGLQFDAPAATVLEDGAQMPGARWFPGAELNFAGHLLGGDESAPAIISRDERGTRRSLSVAELRAEVARVADGLRAAGVRPGDRVAAFLPNVPETVIAMLASAASGAVFSSCSPDFGLDGVVERFGQIRPKVLFAADGYRYGGRRVETLPVVAGLGRRLDGLELLVIVPQFDGQPDCKGLPGAVSYAGFGKHGAGPPEFSPLPFDHPLYVLYSSGTTGRPKCIVHGAGGTLLQHLKEHSLHTDVHARDRVFYYTTCGWMMWNWLVSALASGATIVLYDGSPFHPDPGVLWRLADEERVTAFGVSAKYLAALEKSGYRPRENFSLPDMRTLLSTGSPLAPAGFDFVYESVKTDVQLSSISGGTDLVGCFAAGNPMGPVWRGEIQCPALGMAVEIFDQHGRSLPAGEKGELVCTRPFPSMPVGFWADAGGARYRAAYFERYPGVWAHGDYAEKTPHGGLIIHGRSDAVLNPGGVRIGTAEIYRQVEKLPAVVDAVAIGQRHDGDTRIVLFIVPAKDVELDDALCDRIRRSIRTHATPRHVPAKILAVPDIPRTRSGKIAELAVRAAVHGEAVPNESALANPEALAAFRNRPELRD